MKLYVSHCLACIHHFKCMCLIVFNMVSVMGKVEGQGESWHGHVTAVTVSPEYRRQQLAKKLMNLLEDISDKMWETLVWNFFFTYKVLFHILIFLTIILLLDIDLSDKGYFVDLFVRASNTPAIKMYEKVKYYEYEMLRSLEISLSWWQLRNVRNFVIIIDLYWWNKLFLFFFSQLGYIIYRRVLRYYSGEEDGLGEAWFDLSLWYLLTFILSFYI